MNDQEQLNSIFIENWTSVFNTILGKDVRITIDSVEKKDRSKVKAALRKFQSYLKVSYGEDGTRNIVMALGNRLVSIIANMMVGLDTFKDEITADDRDAFEEAVNQMFSACRVPLKETFGLDMKFKDISFIKTVNTDALMGDTGFKTWNCTIDLQDIGAEKFILVTPRDFGVVKGAGKIGEMAVEAPAAPVREAECVPKGPAPAPTGSALEGSNIDLLLDIELPVTIRIGSTEMRLMDIMKLGPGDIIELEKLVDEPVEVLVNDKLVARGEVVVCDDNFAVRITGVESKAERIKSLG